MSHVSIVKHRSDRKRSSLFWRITKLNLSCTIEVSETYEFVTTGVGLGVQKGGEESVAGMVSVLCVRRNTLRGALAK